MQSPPWFTTLLKRPYKDESINVEGAVINYRIWGGGKKQSLLFVHGHAAHSHWWDFIAPAFPDYNVAAIDMSGNGDSDHRSQYSAVGYARELLALASRLENTIIIGHSFGGIITRVAAFLDPSNIKGIVLVDSLLSTEKSKRVVPDDLKDYSQKPKKKTRYYQNLETGMLRFRLKPPQKCHNQFLIEHIAQHSLKKSDQGYSFKVDQAVFAKMGVDPYIDLPSGVSMIHSITCPIGFIYGDQSRFFPGEKRQFLETLIGVDKLVAIPDAAHHVFLDQPQAFTQALADLLLKLQA